MKRLSLFLMGRKGFVVIRDIINNGYAAMIEQVVIAHDKNMKNDYYEELLFECKNSNITVYDKKDKVEITGDYCLAVAWRWLIPLNNETKLIVLHDSILPKYRGFSPLVNMLINREPFIGVTAIFASEEYDKGNIIAQRKIPVSYPIKITDAINQITPLYSEIVCEILETISNGLKLKSKPQIEAESSYSLWRDENDYCIDWNESSEYIQQFIYSVGYPYKGASTIVNGKLIRVLDCIIVNDVFIENRQIGKVLFVENGCPIIVCNQGLLKITEAFYEDGSNVLPLNRLRLRFQ